MLQCDSGAEPRATFLKALCLVLAGTACLLPIFSSEIPAMSDVSSHVLVARILTNYHDPILRFDQYYDVDWQFRPTEAAYVLLGALQWLFGPYGDVRALMVLWVGLLAGSTAFLASRYRETVPWLAALLSLPLAFSWFVWMGLLPFILTLPLFCIAVGTWLTPMRMAWKIAAIWLLLALLFTTHIVGFCATVAAIAVVGCVQLLRREVDAARFSVLVVAMAPAAVFLAYYLLLSRPPSIGLRYDGVWDQIYTLFHCTWASLTDAGRIQLFVWVVVCVAAPLVGVWQRRLPVHIVTAAAVLAVVGIVVPVDLGGLWPAGPRMFPFALLLLIAASPWPRHRAMATALLALGLLGGLSTVTTARVMEIDRDQRQFLAVASEIQPGARVLSVLGDLTSGSRMTWPYVPLISAATVLKGGVNPFTFAEPYLHTRYTPLTYRHAIRPEARALFNPTGQPNVYRGLGKIYDYVIVWDLPEVVRLALEDDFKEVRRLGKAALWVPRSAGSARGL